MPTAKYLKTLELEDVENIRVEDIRNAYERLKKLYSGNSIVIESMDDDINDGDREQILLQIEEAQSYLMGVFEEKTEKTEEKTEGRMEEIIEESDEEKVEENLSIHLVEEVEQTEDIALDEPVEEVPLTELPVQKEELRDDSEDLEENTVESSTEDLVVEIVANEVTNQEAFEEISVTESPVQEEQLHDDSEDIIENTLDRSVEDITFENPIEEAQQIVEEVEQMEDYEDEFPEITYEQNELEVVSIETPGVTEEISVSQEEPIELKEEPINGPPTSSEVNSQEKEEFKEEPHVVLNIFNIFRENVGFTLEEIADYTNIPVQVLSDIEADRFESFPDSGYLRWCVNSYAKVLELELPKTVDDYMKSYRQWQRERE